MFFTLFISNTVIYLHILYRTMAIYILILILWIANIGED